MIEGSFIETLSKYFKVERPDTRSKGVDIIITLKSNSKARAYALIRRGTLLDDIENSEQKCSFLRPIPEVSEKLPVLIFENSIDCRFCVFMYWRYGTYNIIKNIHWRKLEPLNIDWLEIVLTSNHGDIRFLPNRLFRVEKIISLNSKTLLHGEIRYLRTFREGYKMKSSKTKPDEQLNRLIYGTPEDEFPKDMLDACIFDAVKKLYPDAVVISKLILFESDVLDLFQLNDRRVENQHIYALNMMNNVLVPVADLEILYTPNLWMRNNRTPNLSVTISVQNSEELNNFKKFMDKVYEPISNLII